MTDRKTLVARALAEAQILKDLKAAHEKTRAELAAMFADVGEREVGTLLDHRLGTVALESGGESWYVADAEAFLKWVLKTCPRETEIGVRPAFVKATLDRLKRDGGLVDWDTGAAEIPPGVKKRTNPPKLVERTDPHAGFVVKHWLGAEAAQRVGIEAGPGNITHSGEQTS